MACLFSMMTEMLRATSALRTMIQCIIILFIINFTPNGLFGEYEFRDIYLWLRNRFAKSGRKEEKK